MALSHGINKISSAKSTFSYFLLHQLEMPLPVIQHRLTKIDKKSKRRLIKSALFFSFFGCVLNLICEIYFFRSIKSLLAATTNHWLYTSEVLRYFVHPNLTRYDDMLPTTRYFKNATLGPWYFCWLDRNFYV
jgi:hypothetical protein